MKTSPSTPETDILEQADDTGFCYVVQSRLQKIAKLLELPSVYCVLIPKKRGKMFIQPNRSIDPRTGRLGYVVVEDIDLQKQVMAILTPRYNADERRAAKAEDEHMMELARNFQL